MRFNKQTAKRWAINGITFVVMLVAIDLWQRRDLREEGDVIQLPVGLSQLNGDSAAIAIEGQKPQFLYFFAPWCQVCKLSMGNMESLRQRYPEMTVAAVALDYSSPEEVASFVSDRGFQGTTYLGTEEVRDRFRIEAYPTYYLLDESGRVLTHAVGYSSILGMHARVWWFL